VLRKTGRVTYTSSRGTELQEREYIVAIVLYHYLVAGDRESDRNE
jgi:hypothetical protein